jgi:hypothetical protein
MRILLGFHFRDGDRYRGSIFSKVHPIVESLYPWDDIWVRDSGHDPYNRGASRNLIMMEAERAGFDVVVVCDADSIPERHALAEAISFAANNERLTIPFNQVKVLPANRFLVHPAKYRSIRPVYQYGESCGGIYVATPALWRLIGGMEERILGWGFEDQIILSGSITFAGGPHFVPGVLFNVNHPRDTSSLLIESNDALIRQYHAAEGDPEAFRRLQVGSNAYFQ